MMHITSLQRDAQITIFSYLHPKDVLAFSRTNKAARNLLGNNVEYGSDIIWYAILQHKHAWVIRLYEDIRYPNSCIKELVTLFIRSLVNQHKQIKRKSPQQGPTRNQGPMRS